MEITTHAIFKGKEKNIKYLYFPVLALEPGNFSNFSKDKRYWKESDEDRSLMKISHIMERAMNLDHLTLYRKSDKNSAIILENFTRKRQLEAEIRIHVTENYASIWKAIYKFKFRINKFEHNLRSKSGLAVDYAVLKIRDKTEKLRLPDDEE